MIVLVDLSWLSMALSEIVESSSSSFDSKSIGDAPSNLKRAGESLRLFVAERFGGGFETVETSSLLFDSK